MITIGEILHEAELRRKIFDIVIEPPCKECDFWDRQGHYCFLDNTLERYKLWKCKLVARILKEI